MADSEFRDRIRGGIWSIQDGDTQALCRYQIDRIQTSSHASNDTKTLCLGENICRKRFESGDKSDVPPAQLF